ncbi:Abi family protein [Dietzia kunjamensis]|jgi:hypothetical protein|uniref:Abi family protein n=1 Tax=Dietzia kunjamensis TaxID=322509 RepID=UPI002096D0B4|nr:Abi family protein [Dietzia kunjamensis]USX48009.1 Abi family protein [Dietzia kunjamensis]
MSELSTAASDAARMNTALDRAVSPDRYGSYLGAAGQDAELARRLYVWDRDVATAVLADIAIVEVALRNAMHRVLSQQYGPRWYESIDLDERSQRQISGAWDQVNKARKLDPTNPKTPGRLVAGCSFGVWVNLLDTGGHAGKQPRRKHVDYEQMWRTCLHTAFPGGRAEASLVGNQFTRSWTHSVAKTVNVLRNRVAHHEPVHNGYPLPGQIDPITRRTRRLTVADGLDNYLKLTRMIDRDLADWISGNSTVRSILSSKPQ